MDQRSARGRVQSAILTYLLIFVGLNLAVWTWFVLHRHGAHRFPLGERVERFGDLLRFSGKYQVGKDSRIADSEHLIGTLFPTNYPPLSVVVYLFLLQVCAPYAMPVFAATVIGAVITACALLRNGVRRLPAYRWYIGAAIFATGLFGWGTEEVLMRGNIEGLMWIWVCIGAFLYGRHRKNSAAVAFGVASCLKPYPILWLALMARHRQFKAVVWGLLTSVGVTLASLLVIDRNPIKAYHRISGLSNFFENYIVSFRPMDEMIGDHSILQSMKTISRVIRNHGLTFSTWDYGMHPSDPFAAKLYKVCLPLTAGFGLIVLWRVWNKPVINQIFALACVTTALPLVAADYTLTVILIPMGFFVVYLLQDVAEGKHFMSTQDMLWYLLPCVAVTATEPLWVLHGVINCVALIVLLTVSMTIPLPSTLFGELPAGA